jgi:hypothetical protein
MKRKIKRITSLAITLVLILSVGTQAISGSSTDTPNWGDVDGNGYINAADVTALRRYIAASDKVAFVAENPWFNEANADANGDGKIDAADVTLLRKYLAATDPLTVILGPRGASTVGLIAEPNKTYAISVKAHNISTFTGVTYTLNYAPDRLRLLNFAAQTPRSSVNPGVVRDTDLEILSHDTLAGILTFRVNKNIQPIWAGDITVLRFRGVGVGITEVSITQ